MNSFNPRVLILPMMLCLIAGPIFGAETAAPAKLQAAIILKLLPMYNNLASKEFSIHVIGSPEVAAELLTMVGKAAGKATLKTVTSSDDLPGGQADIIYIGSHSSAGIEYGTKNHILSITGDLNTVKSGAIIGISLEDAKPKIYLNLASSKAAGADWNPAILKVATPIN